MASACALTIFTREGEKRLLLGHLKIQCFAAVGALGCAVQQLVLFKDGGGAALRAGHFVLDRAILGSFLVLAFQRDLKGHTAVGAIGFACVQIILADVDGLAAVGAGHLVEGLAGDVVIVCVVVFVGFLL